MVQNLTIINVFSQTQPWAVHANYMYIRPVVMFNEILMYIAFLGIASWHSNKLLLSVSNPYFICV